MKELKEIRDEIDAIDTDLVSLFQQRMALAEEVAAYKIANNKSVYDKERENAKLESLASLVPNEFLKQGVVELFEQIMSISRKKQYRLLADCGRMEPLGFAEIPAFASTGKRVVFQGVEGAYAQMAMKRFFGESCDGTSVATWRDAMEEIQSGRVDYAVLPIENSSAGIVAENYDLLMEYDVTILGEQIISIDHALLGIKGATIEDIDVVYSHPQALMQCGEYLEKEHPGMERKALKNTAVAAQKIKTDGKKNQAAIAGIHNAEIYGLEVLEEAIQDNKDNETRFIIVAKDKTYLETANKVSLCFELPDDGEAGALYHIMSHFIFNGLNLTRIESRPSKDGTWGYQFFIDFEGNLRQEAVVNALRGLKEETTTFKILGNYETSSATGPKKE